MPFQSEKQRRFLHANHPEIAKRWERDYAGGGITRLGYRFGGNPHEATQGSTGAGQSSGGGGQGSDYGQFARAVARTINNPPPTPGGGGDGPPSILNPPKGPRYQNVHQTGAVTQTPGRSRVGITSNYMNPVFRKAAINKIKQHQLANRPVTQFETWKSMFGANVKPIGYLPENIKPKGTVEKSVYNYAIKPNIGAQDFKSWYETLDAKPADINFATTIQKELELSDKVKAVGKDYVESLDIKGLGDSYDDQRKAFNTLSNKISTGKKRGKNTSNLKKDYLDNKKEYKDLGVNNMDEFEILLEKTFKEGGLARKNYFHGGILDIDASEEIISDDGNDIELTDYNAAFDDPNDLSTGVKSLFQAKDGGTPQLAKKSKDGKRPGYQGWPGPGAGAPEATSSSTGGGGDQEDDVAQMMSDMGLISHEGPDYSGDRGWVESEDEETQIGGADYIGPIDQIRIGQDITKRKKKYDSLWETGKRGYKILKSIPKPTGVLWVDIPRMGYFMIQQNKLKKERIAEIDYDLSLLDKIGATKFTPHTNTIYQTLEQEKLDLLQPRTDEGDPKHDPVPIYNPTTGAVSEEYAQGYPDQEFDAYKWIKGHQAARTAAVPDWQLTAEERELKNNPIVMTANSGGLANLFRVKNQ